MTELDILVYLKVRVKLVQSYSYHAYQNSKLLIAVVKNALLVLKRAIVNIKNIEIRITQV